MVICIRWPLPLLSTSLVKAEIRVGVTAVAQANRRNLTSPPLQSQTEQQQQLQQQPQNSQPQSPHAALPSPSLNTSTPTHCTCTSRRPCPSSLPSPRPAVLYRPSVLPRVCQHPGRDESGDGGGEKGSGGGRTPLNLSEFFASENTRLGRVRDYSGMAEDGGEEGSGGDDGRVCGVCGGVCNEGMDSGKSTTDGNSNKRIERNSVRDENNHDRRNSTEGRGICGEADGEGSNGVDTGRTNGNAICNDVITVSHFIPREELCGTVWLRTRALSRVFGATRIDKQLRECRSKLHIFGHSHMNMDVHIQGVRYVQHALGGPRERCRGMHPKCIWKQEHFSKDT
eukprot:GHVQ01000760.1.p2 GENE.GHVQ01000760.1~~GHVQ01000760.1.p2  ORF type:complete len:340 (-),score=67.00 GHVQ01000760.1:155-1174(-)